MNEKLVVAPEIEEQHLTKIETDSGHFQSVSGLDSSPQKVSALFDYEDNSAQAGSADIEVIRKLIDGDDIDISTYLKAPAAGHAAESVASMENAGGGHRIARFELTAEEVTPDAGAETVGIGFSFTDPVPGPVLSNAEVDDPGMADLPSSVSTHLPTTGVENWILEDFRQTDNHESASAEGSQDGIPVTAQASVFGYSSYEGSGDVPDGVTVDVLTGNPGELVAVSVSDPGIGSVEIVDNQVFFTPGPAFAGSTDISYTIDNGDGTQAEGNLQVVERYFKVGSNDDDTGSAGLPYAAGAGSGTISGGSAADILVGDAGGAGYEGGDLNLLLIMDTSGSMGWTDAQVNMENAINELMEDFSTSGLENVRVHLVEYNSGSTYVGTPANSGTFDLVVNNGLQVDSLESAQAAVTALNAGGNTNYEAGMQEGLSWIYTDADHTFTGSELRSPDAGGPLNSPGVINVTLFLTDGDPNQVITNSGNSVWVGYTERAMNEILGTYDPAGTDSDDNASEVDALQAWGTLRAVGIDVDSSDNTVITRLNGIDDQTDAIISTSDGLSAVLPDSVGLNTLFGVGDDIINGGGGNDLIFGDSLFTDNVVADLIDQGILQVGDDPELRAGSGWAVFEALENDSGIAWSRTDTINYILDHQEQLSAVSTDSAGGNRDGGSDTIFAGEGNDTVYSQESGDIIDGQAGNDLLVADIGDDVVYGGSGDDNLMGGEGDDQLVGEEGADTLYGNQGNDILIGDSIEFDSTDASANIIDEASNDIDSLIGGDQVDTSFDEGADDMYPDGSVEIINDSVAGFDEDIDNLVLPPDPGVI